MEGCDATAEGTPTELTEHRYCRYARGGAGLIWFEATTVVQDGRSSSSDLWLHPGNAR